MTGGTAKSIYFVFALRSNLFANNKHTPRITNNFEQIIWKQQVFLEKNAVAKQ